MSRHLVLAALTTVLLSGCFFQKDAPVAPSAPTPAQSGSASTTEARTGAHTGTGEPAAMTEAETEATMKEIEALINEAVASGSTNASGATN